MEENEEAVVVGNDFDWIDPEVKQHRDNINKLLSYGHWKKIAMRQGFWKEVESVLPKLWALQGWSAKKPTKKDATAAMAKYGATVTSIALEKKLKQKHVRVLNCKDQHVELKKMDEFERKAFFVELDLATKLESVSKENQRLLASSMAKLARTEEMKIADAEEALAELEAVDDDNDGEED